MEWTNQQKNHETKQKERNIKKSHTLQEKSQHSHTNAGKTKQEICADHQLNIEVCKLCHSWSLTWQHVGGDQGLGLER